MVPRAMGLRGGSPGGGQASGRGNPGEGGAARVWGLFGGGSHTFGGEWGRSWLRSPPRRRTRRVNLSLPQLRPHGRLPTQSRPNSGAPPRATRAPAPSLLPSRPFSLAISAPYPSPCPYSPPRSSARSTTCTATFVDVPDTERLSVIASSGRSAQTKPRGSPEQSEMRMQRRFCSQAVL